MKFINISEAGGPEVLRLAESDKPAIGDGEVLIKVAAAGVNRLDLLQRQGLYPPPPGAPDIPGVEVAGEVVERGEGVDWPARGEQVCALVNGGGYAQYCAADAGACLPVPAGLSTEQAAALPETFFTVWSNVFDRGQLKAGECLLVHGGSSGIGTTAIQLGKVMGARVFATAGSAEKCSACEELGAEKAINYREQDFVEQCLGFTRGKGIDVVLDIVAGSYINRNLQVAAADGRIIMIAGLQGFRAEVDFQALLRNRLTLTGSTLRSRSAAFKADIAGKLRQQVWPLLEAGKVKPVIYRVFPLAEAGKAHELMASGEHIGKILLSV